VATHSGEERCVALLVGVGRPYGSAFLHVAGLEALALVPHRTRLGHVIEIGVTEEHAEADLGILTLRSMQKLGMGSRATPAALHVTCARTYAPFVATKRPSTEGRLHAAVELGKRGGPALATEIVPFLRDKVGIVAAAAATIVAEHDLRGLERELEATFERFLDDPAKTDPGCRAKLAAAEALRRLDVRSPDVYLRGIALKQLEASWGPPLDTAAPLRVCCAAALLETRHPMAMIEVGPLLADAEPNARAGVAAVMGGVGGEACEALLRLKIRTGDREPEVVGACLEALLQASFERAFPFVLAEMKNASDDVIRLGLLALGETREERALPVLRQYAEGPWEKEVRATALIAASISRLPAANDYLLSLVEGAQERRALDAISALGSQRVDSALMDRLGALAAARGGHVRDAYLAMMRRD
jgi:hypothetical protein